MWTLLYYIICRLYIEHRLPLLGEIVLIGVEKSGAFRNRDEIYNIINRLRESNLIKIGYLNMEEKLTDTTIIIPTCSIENCMKLIAAVEKTAENPRTFFDEVVRRLVTAVKNYLESS